MKLITSAIIDNARLDLIQIPADVAVINPTLLKIDIESELSESADYVMQALAWFNTQPSPAFHNVIVAYWSLKLKDDHNYGVVRGEMTSSGNIIIEGWCDRDEEDTMVFLGYCGTRGRFQEIGSVMGATVPSLCPDPDLYETSGPQDMWPWEDKAAYVIRTGKCGEEVAQLLTQLSKTNVPAEWSPLHWNAVDGKWLVNSFGSGLACDITILEHWLFDDAELKNVRMNKLRSAVALMQLLQREIASIAE